MQITDQFQNKRTRGLGWVFLVVGLACVAFWVCLGTGESEATPRVRAEKKAPAQKLVRAAQVPRKSARAPVRVEKVARTQEAHPIFISDEEAHLSGAWKRLLDEMQEALDDENFKDYTQLVQKIQNEERAGKVVPVAVKLTAIEGLHWFGAQGIPELVGFLADGQADVASAARDAIQEGTCDPEASDYTRSQMIVQLAQCVTDRDMLESLFDDISNMRHSVAVQTIKRVLVQGTDVAKSVIPESIAFLTGEETITTPQELDAWYQDPDNQDTESDDDLYGGK